MKYQHSIYQISNDREQREKDSRYLRQQPEPEGMSFADIEFNSLNPEPVFRDQVNATLRQPQRTFSWKVI